MLEVGVWNQSGGGRISAVGMSVIGGANVERVQCREDGRNWFDG